MDLNIYHKWCKPQHIIDNEEFQGANMPQLNLGRIYPKAEIHGHSLDN